MNNIFKRWLSGPKETATQETSVGLEREELLSDLAQNWETWTPTVKAPTGWHWLKDNALDGYCLVRYCRGRLDRITRREWYKAYRRLQRQALITE